MQLYPSFVFLVLSSAILAHATGRSPSCSSPCLTSCRFRLCDTPYSVVITSKPDKPRPPAVCDTNGHRLGTTNSGPFYIYESGNLYPPSHIPRHAFKTLSLRSGSSAVAHQYLTPRQSSLLLGKCIVLPITSAQILDGNGSVTKNLNFNRRNPKVNCISFKATDISQKCPPSASYTI